MADPRIGRTSRCRAGIRCVATGWDERCGLNWHPARRLACEEHSARQDRARSAVLGSPNNLPRRISVSSICRSISIRDRTLVSDVIRPCIRKPWMRSSKRRAAISTGSTTSANGIPIPLFPSILADTMTDLVENGRSEITVALLFVFRLRFWVWIDYSLTIFARGYAPYGAQVSHYVI